MTIAAVASVPAMAACVAFVVASLLVGCSAPPESSRHVTRHVRGAGGAIEYFEETPSGGGPWPAMVFLHGHQAGSGRVGGRVFADWGELRRWADKGYVAVSVSLPGYGGSDGPEDFAGAVTQEAVSTVLSALEAEGHIRGHRFIVEGISLGAVTAALVAEHDRRISGLVLVSGLYDFPAFFASPRTDGAREVKAVFDQLTGGSVEALQARSALPHANDIHAPTLILNGAMDDRTDANQARTLALAIRQNGTTATVHVYPDLGHSIPPSVRNAEIERFVDGLRKD